MGWDFLVRLKISFLWCAALVWLKERGQWQSLPERASGLCPSCLLHRRKKWRLLAMGADLASMPCGHQGVLGKLQEKLYFRKCTLRLPSCPVLLQWVLSGVLAEVPPGRIHSLWLLFLEQSKTIEKEAPPSCSLSCYFASFCALRNQLREGLWTPPGWKKWRFLAF